MGSLLLATIYHLTWGRQDTIKSSKSPFLLIQWPSVVVDSEVMYSKSSQFSNPEKNFELKGSLLIAPSFVFTKIHVMPCVTVSIVL